MLERLKEAEIRFDSIEEDLAKPETLGDMERYTSLMKDRAVLAPVIEKYREYKKAQSDAEEALDTDDLTDEMELAEDTEDLLD